MQNPEVVIVPADSPRRPHVALHERQIPNQQAQFALRLIERWGGAGLAFTPYQLVDRAIDVAGEAFSAFESRRWMVDLPSPAELEGQRPIADALEVPLTPPQAVEPRAPARDAGDEIPPF